MKRARCLKCQSLLAERADERALGLCGFCSGYLLDTCAQLRRVLRSIVDADLAFDAAEDEAMDGGGDLTPQYEVRRLALLAAKRLLGA